MKLFLTVTFATIFYGSVSLAFVGHEVLGPWFVPAVLVSPGALLSAFIVRMLRVRSTQKGELQPREHLEKTRDRVSRLAAERKLVESRISVREDRFPNHGFSGHWVCVEGEAMKATRRGRSMFWTIPALLIACEGTEEIVDANQAMGGSANAGNSGSENGGAGGTTTAGAGGKCPGPNKTPLAYCSSDANCGPSQHCDLTTCYASSCWCSNGVISCTADCRHICVDGPGADAGTTELAGGAGVSGAGGMGD